MRQLGCSWHPEFVTEVSTCRILTDFLLAMVKLASNSGTEFYFRTGLLMVRWFLTGCKENSPCLLSS